MGGLRVLNDFVSAESGQRELCDLRIRIPEPVGDGEEITEYVIVMDGKEVGILREPERFCIIKNIPRGSIVTIQVIAFQGSKRVGDVMHNWLTLPIENRWRVEWPDVLAAFSLSLLGGGLLLAVVLMVVRWWVR